MNVDLRYLGKSEVRDGAVSFAPNLARPQVFYDAALREPLRFREAISALHDVVVGDLRFTKRDKTAYEAWRSEQQRERERLRIAAQNAAQVAEAERLARQGPPPAELERRFRRAHKTYWSARIRWANELSRNDPELFRHLVPCDPVVTVAPDVVFFECFAKDESSYGCLSVDRDAFANERTAALGTTNVDYSIALYEHFQTLRSYRDTRFLVDPTGFEVQVEGREGYREEKIDLPPSWLRGFGQISAAMALPSRRVTLAPSAMYSVLAYLKRHREKTGPRSLRLELTPGRVPALVLDPWNVRVSAQGDVYEGPRAEEIKLWGRRRLMVFARLLPLVERFELLALGSGLPSIWVAHMGPMRMTLALSGWTTNDWSSGANLDLLSGAFRSDAAVSAALGAHLETQRVASLGELERVAGAVASVNPRDVRDLTLGGVYALARQGQVVFDFATRLVRYRPILSVPLAESLWGGEHKELTKGRALFRGRAVKLLRDDPSVEPKGGRVLIGSSGGVDCEALLDGDGSFVKGRCSCSFFFKSGLRAGPCRHLLALKLESRAREEGPGASMPPSSFVSWYAWMTSGTARRS